MFTQTDGFSVVLRRAYPPLPITPSELEATEASVRGQLLDFSRGLEAYKRLGLAFENVAADGGATQNIRVVFTLLDPRDAARRFEFDVRVSASDDAYAVSGCAPPVAALEGLVEQLNASNDFARFVQQMRREFKALVR